MLLVDIFLILVFYIFNTTTTYFGIINFNQTNTLEQN